MLGRPTFLHSGGLWVWLVYRRTRGTLWRRDDRGFGHTSVQRQYGAADLLMKDLKLTVLSCTPSYALYIAETIYEMGLDPRKDLSLKAGTFGAEPWSERMRKEIESRLFIKAMDIYGLSEIIGPGISCECECQDGLHISEDHFYPDYATR